MKIGLFEQQMTRIIPSFAGFTEFTSSIPKLYWDVKSQEQRILAICKMLHKVICYADMLGENVDEIAHTMQEILDGKLDPMIVAAIEEWFKTNEPQILQDIDAINAKIGEGFDAENTVASAIDAVAADVTVTNGIIGSGFTAENTVADAIANTTDIIGEGFSAQNTVADAIANTVDIIGDGFSAQNTVADAIDGINYTMNKYNNMIQGAQCVLRIEIAWNEKLQGGCYFKQDNTNYYGIIVVDQSTNEAKRIEIYSLDSNTLVGSVIVNNIGHGNNLDYYNRKLYATGDASLALLAIIDVNIITTPVLEEIKNLSSLGFSNVYGFGHYKDGKWWITANLEYIYVIDENITSAEFLVTQPINNYMTGVQQGLSYSEDDDLFISARSSSITIFKDDLSFVRYYDLDTQYGSVFTEEIEQATIKNKIMYFHNNSYWQLSAADPNRVCAVFKLDPDNLATTPQVLPPVALTISQNAPKIPNFFRSTSYKFYYPKDMYAFATKYSEMVKGTLELETDCDYIVGVPDGCAQVYMNSKKFRGIWVRDDCVIYGLAGQIGTDENLIYTYNGKKCLINGESCSITVISGNKPTADIYLARMYGGIIVKPSYIDDSYFYTQQALLINHS